MKELEVDPNSLTCKFAVKFGGLDSWMLREGYVDSCQFNRAIVFGCFSIVLMAFLCLLLAAAGAVVFGSVIAWMAYCILHHMWIYPDILAALGLFIIVALSIIALIVLTSKKLKEKHLSPFQTELYLSFKDKYCKKIVLKNTPAE